MIINGGRGAPLRRPDKLMGPNNYKTFALRNAVKWVPKPCAEVQCDGYLNGWVMQKERLTDDLYHVVTHSGRSFKEIHTAPGQTLLVFEAGQTCFKSIEDSHLMPVVNGPEIYLAGRGDHRTFNPRAARRHTRAEFWVEEFRTQTEANKALAQKG